MSWMFAYDPDTGKFISHKGDSGGMSTALWTEDGQVKIEHNARPRVGVSMRVGSLYARSFSFQDWWQTTPILEILKEYEDDEGRLNIKFRTKNSYYHWMSD